MDLQTTLGRDPNLGDGERVPTIVNRTLWGQRFNIRSVLLTFILAYLFTQSAGLPLATRAWVTAMLTTEKGTAVKRRTDTPDFTQSIVHLSTYERHLHLYQKLSWLHSLNTLLSSSVGMYSMPTCACPTSIQPRKRVVDGNFVDWQHRQINLIHKLVMRFRTAPFLKVTVEAQAASTTSG